jgi:hypothetical protein
MKLIVKSSETPHPRALFSWGLIAHRDLERDVDSGKLKLVDEKKNLKRITDLKSVRKQLAVFSSAEESMKSDIAKRKALQDELSSSTATPEAKALSEEFNRIREEMAKLKGENDEAFAKRGELKTQRDELQKERDKAYEHRKAVQDEYYKQRDAYRTWTDQNRKVLTKEGSKANWQAQSEKYWKQREEEERARIARNAASRLEEASHDAFATEIWKCENVFPYSVHVSDYSYFGCLVEPTELLRLLLNLLPAVSLLPPLPALSKLQASLNSLRRRIVITMTLFSAQHLKRSNPR